MNFIRSGIRHKYISVLEENLLKAHTYIYPTMIFIRIFCSLLSLCILVTSNTNLKTLFKNLNANELIIFMEEENDYFIGDLVDEVNSHFDHIVRGKNSGFQLLQFLSENSILLFYDVKPNTVSTLITKAQCSKIRKKCNFGKSRCLCQRLKPTFL